jgi:hypothetical protein
MGKKPTREKVQGAPDPYINNMASELRTTRLVSPLRTPFILQNYKKIELASKILKFSVKEFFFTVSIVLPNYRKKII